MLQSEAGVTMDCEPIEVVDIFKYHKDRLTEIV